MYKKNISTIILCLTAGNLAAQSIDTTLKSARFSFHAQATVISQFKPSFPASYSGENSLAPVKESRISITATLYAGFKLWNGGCLFVNPEISGGSGLSAALGVADAPNGETFRVGSNEPEGYLARLFIQQFFPLSSSYEYQQDNQNQLAGYVPAKYIFLTIGKVSLTDFFDDNAYSHDPRTQFLSWGLMDNGAWDYAANTRGYTPSIIVEYITPNNEWRYAVSLEPVIANGNTVNWDIGKVSAHTIEYAHHYHISNHNGTIRLLSFINTADMGNYDQSVAMNPTHPDIILTRRYGRTKYGLEVNIQQALSKNTGFFLRAGWNDGHNETWAFTEIDRTLSGGFMVNAKAWGRPFDNLGLAIANAGISAAHRNYLAHGGLGFMLGDGKLNYGWEHLSEIFYSLALSKNIYITGTYQFLVNPGYNKDRGPVNIFSFRVHSFI